MYHNDKFERNGLTFRFKCENDDTTGYPWEEHDGHGPVRGGDKSTKLPGERVLGRNQRWIYDFATAVRIAKRDWICGEPKATVGVRAVAAVEEDFERMRQWCDDDWNWVGVVVELLDDEDNVIESDSIWGIESDSGDYLETVAFELADGLSAEPMKRMEFAALAQVLAAPQRGEQA